MQKVLVYLSNGSIECYQMEYPEIGTCSIRNGAKYNGIGFANHCGSLFGDDFEEWYEDEHFYQYSEVAAIYFGSECVHHNATYIRDYYDMLAEAYQIEDDFYNDMFISDRYFGFRDNDVKLAFYNMANTIFDRLDK